MSEKIYIPTKCPEDWVELLAEKEKHWKDGYSAKELAKKWQNTNGIPETVLKVLNSSQYDEVMDLKLLIGIPEYKVSLPGGQRASQNDLFVLANNQVGLSIIMVEGKATEPFGQIVQDWEAESTPGKVERMAYLKEILMLSKKEIGSIRYQLLHRTASVIITMREFFAKTGIVLIHSFANNQNTFADYQHFLSLYGIEGKINEISKPLSLKDGNIYFAWVSENSYR